MADFLSSIFGSKPEIAPYQPIDFSQEQLDALEGDLAAWPQIQQLGDYFQNSYLQELNQAIPGFSNILKMGGDVTQTMLTNAKQLELGIVPQDVQDAVQRSSAFQNLLSGGGGGMASANDARNYGLTSLQLMGQGAQLAGQAGNAAQQWAQLSGAGAAGNIMQGMLVTPQQQAQLDMQQNLIKQATQQLQYNVNAAPNPALQALNQWVEQVGGSIVSSYAGGHGGNFATTYQGGATNSDLGLLSQNYQSAGSPTPVFGQSGYPSAIPVGGYQPIGGYGAGGPGSFNDTVALPQAYSGQQSYDPFSDYQFQNFGTFG
jgi:hypothetical protein